ncbi:MAG: hypothetical protein B7733_16895 [Myxococcales bacterium FL481]|nr:MAG: hypothetical protein B7733_16895 [Myxococcales bacterium FL481]
MSPSSTPSPRRRHDAWRAGLRGSGRFARLATASAGLWLVVHFAAGEWLAERPLAWPSASHADGREALRWAARGWLIVALTLAVASGLAAGFSGRFGWVSSGWIHPPLPRPPRVPAAWAWLTWAAWSGLAVAIVRPAIAGAARAVDASTPSLTRFWAAWAEQTLATVAVLGGLWAVLEGIVERRAITSALTLSAEQTRESTPPRRTASPV